jgi:Putative MetA-pathway of phenol degradation
MPAIIIRVLPQSRIAGTGAVELGDSSMDGFGSSPAYGRSRLGAFAVLATAALAGTVAQPQPAQAGKLNTFVTDLFGGQGIVINDPGEGLEVLAITSGSLQAFGGINSNVATNLGGSALSSSVAASLFDISQGMPVTTTESLGPLVGERAETLGQGRFDLGVSVGHTTFTRLNNVPINNLTAAAQSPGCIVSGTLGCDDVVNVNVNLKIERSTLAFTGAYGITPKWDVGIIVPIVHMVAKSSATATLTDLGADGDTFLNGSLVQRSSAGGEATGIGDVILRTKYNFLRDMPSLPDFAVYGEIKAPTGSQSDLIGSGNTDVLAEVVLSKQLGAIAPHLNLGYQVALGHGTDRSNLRYVVGADARVSESVTVAADVVGRLDDAGLNLTDFVVGAKWNVFGSHIVSASFLVPINRSQGLRPDYAWTTRWEMGF